MKIRHWYVYCLYLFVVSVVLMGISFSRFSSTLANTGAENTVPPDIEFSTWVLEHEAASVSLADMLPGDSRTITVRVQNWAESEAGEKISGYDQSVTLELITTGNLPLTFTLTKDGEGEVPLSHPGAFQYTSQTQYFLAGSKETKEYTLTVSWPPDSKDYRYRDEIDYLELKLRAVQS